MLKVLLSDIAGLLSISIFFCVQNFFYVTSVHYVTRLIHLKTPLIHSIHCLTFTFIRFLLYQRPTSSNMPLQKYFHTIPLKYIHRPTILHILPINKIKGKAIPLQTCTGPECSSRLELTDFKTIDT
jgi:hypothetical protein